MFASFLSIMILLEGAVLVLIGRVCYTAPCQKARLKHFSDRDMQSRFEISLGGRGVTHKDYREILTPDPNV
jgi:hypothetical protein